MPAAKALSVPATYAELRRAVEVAMIKGQQAVEQARVRTYHETGRHYYALDNQPLEVLPDQASARPAREFLEWHQGIFKS